MKPYIADFVAPFEVESFFLIADPPQLKKSKKDSQYLIIKLQDKTGELDSRMWDVPKGLDISSLRNCIVKVRGTIGEWNDTNQLKIDRLRVATEEDGIDLSDFFEKSPRDVDEMWGELGGLLIAHVKNEHLARLLELILQENEDEFKLAPAAKSVHHAYLGGLLEHVVSLCRTSAAMSQLYGLDCSLMLTACVLHDIGKIRELSYRMGTSYTIEGTLLGHISIGMEMVAKAINKLDKVRDFPQDLRVAVMHMIASHHGLLEFGSPKIPLMREAIAFHLADMIDSRMAICNRVLKDGVSPEGLSAWSKELGGPLWRMPE